MTDVEYAGQVLQRVYRLAQFNRALIEKAVDWRVNFQGRINALGRAESIDFLIGNANGFETDAMTAVLAR
jgi:hypothetical protein